MTLNMFYTAEIRTPGVKRFLFKAAFKFGLTISDYIASKHMFRNASVTYRDDIGEEELYAYSYINSIGSLA